MRQANGPPKQHTFLVSILVATLLSVIGFTNPDPSTIVADNVVTASADETTPPPIFTDTGGEDVTKEAANTSHYDPAAAINHPTETDGAYALTLWRRIGIDRPISTDSNIAPTARHLTASATARASPPMRPLLT
ncbi:MAG: hypothetical protein Q7N87_05095 [Candidatus Uhrbacteria bacterium]|nr:hypothetical protein [Candidatus Uhrbacteria bacterium]MDP3793978.1 hypothetical protein [Candidatus Uhrbacteria bacterium]